MMKRLLLATTALGMSAGMAIADVTVGGDGRMGVVIDNDENATFSSRVRVSFTASAELDGGMTAGGSIRADNSVAGKDGVGGSVHLAGSFGKLSMGDVDPGAKAALGHVAGVGFTNLGDLNEITYTRGGDGEDPTLQYMLPMMGPVQAYASVGQSDGEISFDTFSIGAKADLAVGMDDGTAWLGAGFEGTPDENADGKVIVGAGASVSGFSGTLLAGTGDDEDQFAVSARYSAGQIGATVFYADDTDIDGGAEALGVGLDWSLGGGASIKAGVATNIAQEEGADDTRTADLGVTFSF